MRAFTISISCLLFLVAAPIGADEAKEDVPKTCALTVVMKGFESNEGTAMVALHDKPEAFPTKRKLVHSYVIGTITNKTSTVVFKNLPYGTYAVAVFHDENGNGELDTNLLGIPKEGMGSSNDAPASFGPPEWEDAKISLSSEKKTITINLSY